LLESELFGHEKGAFSGADRKRIGKFEQCTGGTLFMDEIGDMTPLMQTKVLRVLQDQKFERVGGNETVSTDVRLITATNRNLEDMIEKSDFRSDLYYRLNVYTIELPPLRERGDDIQLLAEHFCSVFAAELGKEITAIADASVRLLKAYQWPGNVRELQSVIKHALLEATGPVLVPAFLPDAVRNIRRTLPTGHEEAGAMDIAVHKAVPIPVRGTENGTDVTNWPQFVIEQLRKPTHAIYEDALQLMERQIIPRVLQHAAGNQLQAAKLLGISRATLRTKCRQHGITVDRVVDTGD
jgi:two-component system nitrogen regulation response regulator GlnG